MALIGTVQIRNKINAVRMLILCQHAEARFSAPPPKLRLHGALQMCLLLLLLL